MQRFARQRPPARKGSERENVGSGMVVSKRPGIILRTGAINWVSSHRVEVAGGYYLGNLGAADDTYFLRKILGRWYVIRRVRHWMA
jgi:hypothetical protein